MLDVEMLARLVQGMVIVNLLIELALLYGLINLIDKMFDHGDSLWGYAASIITFVMIVDHGVKRVLPNVGALLVLASFIGVLVVVMFGWLRHKKYDAKKQMIILTLLVGAQLLLVVLGIAILLSISPTDPPSAR